MTDEERDELEYDGRRAEWHAYGHDLAAGVLYGLASDMRARAERLVGEDMGSRAGREVLTAYAAYWDDEAATREECRNWWRRRVEAAFRRIADQNGRARG